MKLLTASAGSYPRIGDTKRLQRLRQAHGDLEKGAITPGQFEEVQRSVTAEVIAEQEAAGLDVVTDGQIRWHDPISHLAAKMTGVTIDRLLRFFDTNFYFRQPVVTGPISWKEPIIAEEYRLARKMTRRTLKPVLTGPYTLARLSIVRSDRYGGLRALAMDYARAIAREVEQLVAAKAAMIQIDEPAILKHPTEFAVLRESLAPIIAEKGNAKLVLATYFGDAAPLYEQFQGLAVDVLAFDFSYSPTLADRIEREGSDKVLSLGLIDGRNTRIENRREVLALLLRLVRKSAGKKAYLAPTCGLEYLPRDRARAKLKAIGAIRRSFMNGKAR